MIKVIQTAKEYDKPWMKKDSFEMSDKFDFNNETIEINSDVTFQSHKGFGGAFTEASAYTFANTSEENKKKILDAYFDKEKGIGYNIGRTTIGGCDFSLNPYTYVEENDDELKSFDMSHDDDWIVPLLNEAEKTAGQKIELMCSPWSPPAFMKTNNDINHGGKLKKEYYAAWAKYMVKYIKGMRDRGFNIEMVSVQNEPDATQIWASCIYSGTDEAVFATDFLYPELKEAGLDDKVNIIIWDHNKDIIVRRAKESFDYKNTKEIVWGMAYHWYCCEKAENLTMVHNAYPNLHLLFTEGCVELANSSGPTSSKEGAGAWVHGETYGRNIINDFNNFCEGWIDWNLILDEQGGPNYVANYCEAPIMVDRDTDELMINTSYYYIGHFAKYIKQGAKRLQCLNDVENDLYSLAYKNPDGEIIIVVQNESDDEKTLSIVLDKKGANQTVPAHSITTYVVGK